MHSGLVGANIGAAVWIYWSHMIDGGISFLPVEPSCIGSELTLVSGVAVAVSSSRYLLSDLGRTVAVLPLTFCLFLPILGFLCGEQYNKRIESREIFGHFLPKRKRRHTGNRTCDERTEWQSQLLIEECTFAQYSSRPDLGNRKYILQ